MDFFDGFVEFVCGFFVGCYGRVRIFNYFIVVGQDVCFKSFLEMNKIFLSYMFNEVLSCCLLFCFV